MSALAITVMPLVRPAYRNTHIADYGSWSLDNACRLCDWWIACGKAMGASDPHAADPDEFEQFIRTQWEQEQIRHV